MSVDAGCLLVLFSWTVQLITTKIWYLCVCVCWKVDEMYQEAPIKGGNFDYIEFTRILKHGKKDDWCGCVHVGWREQKASFPVSYVIIAGLINVAVDRYHIFKWASSVYFILNRKLTIVRYVYDTVLFQCWLPFPCRPWNSASFVFTWFVKYWCIFWCATRLYFCFAVFHMQVFFCEIWIYDDDFTKLLAWFFF